MPQGTEYIWSWYRELEAGRAFTGFGPGPIPPSEILAWCQLKGIRLKPWEYSAIQYLDVEFLRSFNTKAREEVPPGSEV